MSNENRPNEDDDEFPDLTVDPADPEPIFADRNNHTEEEDLRYAEWLTRNFDAIAERGTECFIDD